MFRVLLAADNFMGLEVNKELKQLRVKIDETKLVYCGRKAMGDLLLHVHIHRCTADVEAAKKYFGELTAINEEWLGIREIVRRERSSCRPILYSKETSYTSRSMTGPRKVSCRAGQIVALC